MSVFLWIYSLGKAAAALTWECNILKSFMMFVNSEILLILIKIISTANKNKMWNGLKLEETLKPLLWAELNKYSVFKNFNSIFSKQTVTIVSSLCFSVGFSSKCSDSVCVLQLGDSFLHGNKGDQLPFAPDVW